MGIRLAVALLLLGVVLLWPAPLVGAVLMVGAGARLALVLEAELLTGPAGREGFTPPA